jgi:amino acid transporter
LVKSIFGENGRFLMAILAITAAGSSFNTGLAAISRMLYGMANNSQLPTVFSTLHKEFKTPWLSILFPCSITLIIYAIFGNSQDTVITLMISATTVWLLVYLIAHVDLIVLRRKYPQYHRPYKSPFYPLPQIIGIICMGYLIVNNSPSPEMTRDVYLNVGLLVGITNIYAVFWIRYKMKKKFFKAEHIEKIISTHTNHKRKEE